MRDGDLQSALFTIISRDGIQVTFLDRSCSLGVQDNLVANNFPNGPFRSRVLRGRWPGFWARRHQPISEPSRPNSADVILKVVPENRRGPPACGSLSLAPGLPASAPRSQTHPSHNVSPPLAHVSVLTTLVSGGEWLSRVGVELDVIVVDDG